MRTIRLSLLVVAALLAVPDRVRAAGDADPGKDVVLKTDDNMKIAATYWGTPAYDVAGVVLLHMEGSDRTAWKPLVAHLRARNIQVVAVDLRGHGGSAKQGYVDSSKRAAARDPKLFGEMHRDVIAAARHLVKQGKCDAKRVALVGAGVGASVALDAARRYPGETCATLCMTPPAAFPGFDDAAAAKAYPAAAPLLVLAHKDEADAGANALSSAVAGASLVVYDEGRPRDVQGEQWAHGTRMLGRVPLVEQTIASFVASRTGSTKDDVVLDGLVDEETKEGGAWTKATRFGKDDVEGWAYRVGRRLQFGGRVKGKKRGLTVGVNCNFTAATFPGQTTDPEHGLPESAGLDADVRGWSWVAPWDFGKGLRMHDSGLRARPVVRIVPAADGGYTFEGEWTTEYGESAGGPVDPLKVSVAYETSDGPPERPKTIGDNALMMVLSWTDAAVAIPSR
jgi:pimeloyl-ACP methyl ester carboxylesterase